jgi:hypothetical protein
MAVLLKSQKRLSKVEAMVVARTIYETALAVFRRQSQDQRQEEIANTGSSTAILESRISARKPLIHALRHVCAWRWSSGSQTDR